MGFLKSWMNEMGNTWEGMKVGDPNSFMGTGPAGGAKAVRGTGNGHKTPDGHAITPAQEEKLMEFYHKQYGEYPASAYQFQQWLRKNW